MNSQPRASSIVRDFPFVDQRTAPKRILVADADDIVRGSLVAVLELEGFVVEEAGDGLQAVSRAILQRPALVLLDLDMPRANNLAVIGRLQRVASLFPIIMIAANSNQYRHALRLKADAFMEKPLNIPILLGAIHRLAREYPAQATRASADPAFITEFLNPG